MSACHCWLVFVGLYLSSLLAAVFCCAVKEVDKGLLERPMRRFRLEVWHGKIWPGLWPDLQTLVVFYFSFRLDGSL